MSRHEHFDSTLSSFSSLSYLIFYGFLHSLQNQGKGKIYPTIKPYKCEFNIKNSIFVRNECLKQCIIHT